jgi:preprotein translocase subunit YajC
MDFNQLIFDLIVLGLFVLGIYVFSVLPRQREFRQRQKMVSELKPGTEVVTYGGLIGTVKQVDGEQGVVIVEIAKGIEARFLAQAITSQLDQEAIAESVKKASK